METGLREVDDKSGDRTARGGQQKWRQDCERWTTKMETGLREVTRQKWRQCGSADTTKVEKGLRKVDDQSGDRTARGG